MAERAERVQRDNPEVAHETADVNVGGILRFGLAMAVAAVVIHIALYWLFLHYNQREAQKWPAARHSEGPEEPPVEPRLRVAPRADLAEMRGAEERLLRSYGWIDREKSIVRVPIERAMESIVGKGVPVRKQTPQETKESARINRDQQGDR